VLCSPPEQATLFLQRCVWTVCLWQSDFAYLHTHIRKL